ncbi:MAG: hypothetical protein RXN77_05910 [Sulfolobaceae archaeon]|nr:hypothetical protein [Sulfolobales archaeon]
MILVPHLSILHITRLTAVSTASSTQLITTYTLKVRGWNQAFPSPGRCSETSDPSQDLNRLGL